MKNSKKIVAIALALVMLVGGVIAGTMAWFTDDESANDVVVVGSVGISLEYSMQDNVQLMPSTAEKTNDVDQILKVTNTGKAADNDSSAYVRVQVYVPASYASYLHFKQTNDDWTKINSDDAKTAAKGTNANVTIGGIEYVNYTLYYTKGTLAVETTTTDAFTAIYLDQYVDCNTVNVAEEGEPEDLKIQYFYDTTPLTDLNNGDAEIYVVAEAIQDSGFDNANDAWVAFNDQTTKGYHAEDYVPYTLAP